MPTRQRTPTDRPFHIALTDLMDELDIGTNELARRTEYGHASISYWRRPPTDPKHLPIRSENIDKIAHALTTRARETGRPLVQPEYFYEYRKELLRRALEDQLDQLARADAWKTSLRRLRRLY